MLCTAEASSSSHGIADRLMLVEAYYRSQHEARARPAFLCNSKASHWTFEMLRLLEISLPPAYAIMLKRTPRIFSTFHGRINISRGLICQPRHGHIQLTVVWKSETCSCSRSLSISCRFWSCEGCEFADLGRETFVRHARRGGPRHEL